MKRTKKLKRHITTLIVATFVTFVSIGTTNIVEGQDLILEADALVIEDITPKMTSNDPRDRMIGKIPPAKPSNPYEGLTIEEHISKVCEEYGINDSIPLAIARLETGHFTSNAYLYKNNPGGMSVKEIPITYATIEDGVEAFVSNLAENYFDIGLTTPETIAQKYCPVNASHWSSMVTQLM